MRKTLVTFAALALSTQIAGLAPAAAKAPQHDVPTEVRMLEGTYAGVWTMYGIDKTGKIVKNVSWTDTVKASGSQVQGNQAFVTTASVMTFDGGQIPPYKMQGREGYTLKQDGSLGSYFIEMAGQTHQMVRVGQNVWSYTAKANARELSRLGFPAGATGQHVLVKVITNEQGVETHRISRLTTVNWKNSQGTDQSLSFVSLRGYHARLK